MPPFGPFCVPGHCYRHYWWCKVYKTLLVYSINNKIFLKKTYLLVEPAAWAFLVLLSVVTWWPCIGPLSFRTLTSSLAVVTWQWVLVVVVTAAS